MKLRHFGVLSVITVAFGVMFVTIILPRPATSGTDVKADVAALAFEPYEAQRVIYHVTDGESLMERKWKNLLHVARNHVDAVAFGELDLRIVMQGGGLDLLRAATKDSALASDIDRLKKQGVRFIVCRNSLVLKGINPSTLYGVRHADIVSSSVAEAAKLAKDGFVYMRF
jgi:uncharacterized protein